MRVRAGQTHIKLPRDFYDFYRHPSIIDAEKKSFPTLMFPTTFNEYLVIKEGNPDSFGHRGRPAYCCLSPHKQKLFFWPPADAAYDITVDYLSAPKQL